jgi:hypothetical protein
MVKRTRVGWVDGTEIGRRHDPDRLPGWTVELVVKEGLGKQIKTGGSAFVVQLDGRSTGPVFFVLTKAEYQRWKMAHHDRMVHEHEEVRSKVG